MYGRFEVHVARGRSGSNYYKYHWQLLEATKRDTATKPSWNAASYGLGLNPLGMSSRMRLVTSATEPPNPKAPCSPKFLSSGLGHKPTHGGNLEQ